MIPSEIFQLCSVSLTTNSNVIYINNLCKILVQTFLKPVYELQFLLSGLAKSFAETAVF